MVWPPLQRVKKTHVFAGFRLGPKGTSRHAAAGDLPPATSLAPPGTDLGGQGSAPEEPGTGVASALSPWEEAAGATFDVMSMNGGEMVSL